MTRQPKLVPFGYADLYQLRSAFLGLAQRIVDSAEPCGVDRFSVPEELIDELHQLVSKEQ